MEGEQLWRLALKLLGTLGHFGIAASGEQSDRATFVGPRVQRVEGDRLIGKAKRFARSSDRRQELSIALQPVWSAAR